MSKLVLSVIRRYFVQFRFRHRFYPFSDDLQSGRLLFFVTGRSKSGTTWMGRLLNSHPEIFCDITENSAFHQDFTYQYFGKPTSSLHPGVGGFFESRTLALMKNGLITNLIFRCDKFTAKRFGDKTPRQNINRIFASLPESKVILMLRDFRDVAVSLAFHNLRITGSWEGFFANEDKKGLDNNFIESHLENYEEHQDIRQYLKYSSEKPRQVMIVRFEDLKADTYGTLKRTLEFLNVDTSDKKVNDCIDENTFKKLTRGRRPGEEDTKSFFRKGIVGDWKNHFSNENVEVFKKVAGESLILAGYEKDNDWGL